MTKPKQKQKPTTVPAVAASMKQAATIWNLPLPAIKTAKTAGAPGFERQRVHRAPLLRWLKSHPEVLAAAKTQGDTAELKREKLVLEIAISKQRFERELETTFPTAEFHEKMAELREILYEEAKAVLEPDHNRIFVDRCESRISELSKP